MYFFIPSVIYEPPPFPEFISVPLEVVVPVELNIKRKTLPLKVAKFLLFMGLIFLAISYGPSLFYALRGSERLGDKLASTASASSVSGALADSWQPTFDRNLPLTNSISIPSIHVKTELMEATNDDFEAALKNGVWRVNNFGTPYNREFPTILAAHRYGYLAWSLDFRLHQSFYNLPNLKVGDTVQIVWRQRKYVYAVYKEENSKEISDYSADLILYTCEDLSSDIRIIKYAKLLKI